MLVIVRYDLHSKLYLFESVSNNFVISPTSFIGTGVLSSRSFFDEFLHSLLNVGVGFLFWRAHHASLDVRDHEENEGHEQKDRNCAQQSIYLIFSLWVIFFSFCKLINSHWISVNYVLEPRSSFADSRVSHLTHIFSVFTFQKSQINCNLLDLIILYCHQIRLRHQNSSGIALNILILI